LDDLPGKPKAADCARGLARHYASSQHGWRCGRRSACRQKAASWSATGNNDSNKLEIRVFGNEAHRQAVVIARLDNLGKGASGAAVQNLQVDAGSLTWQNELQLSKSSSGAPDCRTTFRTTSAENPRA
jgi:N-acetyl-gamma-glutamyl-phosphate reductase